MSVSLSSLVPALMVYNMVVCIFFAFTRTKERNASARRAAAAPAPVMSTTLPDLTLLHYNTRLRLHDRFARMLQEAPPPLHITEDITIFIDRNVRGGDPRAAIQRHFDPEQHKLMIERRPNEGLTPVFKRPEILQFHHDSVSFILLYFIPFCSCCTVLWE